MPASWAMAGICRTVLVEQPSAMSTAMAFLKASRVAMSLGLMFFLRSSMIFMPACLASRRRAALTARIVPFPGRPRPRASVTQFMELAVYIPEQEPQPGHAQSSELVELFQAHAF